MHVVLFPDTPEVVWEKSGVFVFTFKGAEDIMSLTYLIWHLSQEPTPGDAWISGLCHLPIGEQQASQAHAFCKGILWLIQHSRFCLSQSWTWKTSVKWFLGLEGGRVSRRAAAVCGGAGSCLHLECFGVFEQLWLSWPSGVDDVCLGTGEAALGPHSGHRTFLHGF